ncbi:MAG: flagellar export chaperone FliS [Pseudomonadota bacterium]
MFGVMNNPAAAYRKAGLETQIDTANPHQLVLMLFTGAITAISSAAQHMAAQFKATGLDAMEVAKKAEEISRAIDIIDRGLKACLDQQAGGELSERLAALYEYMCNRLLTANLRNDQAALEEVKSLLIELKGAWEEIAADPAVVSDSRKVA